MYILLQKTTYNWFILMLETNENYHKVNEVVSIWPPENLTKNYAGDQEGGGQVSHQVISQTNVRSVPRVQAFVRSEPCLKNILACQRWMVS